MNKLLYIIELKLVIINQVLTEDYLTKQTNITTIYNNIKTEIIYKVY